jgi:hypothetical protein
LLTEIKVIHKEIFLLKIFTVVVRLVYGQMYG